MDFVVFYSDIQSNWRKRAGMSSRSFKCVLRMKWNSSQLCVRNKQKKLSMLKPLMIRRLLWKPEATVWYSHGSCIDAEFGQSVLAVFYSTARLNTLKCNSRFWVNLWPSSQGAERRFGPDVASVAWCCKGMSLVCACVYVCGNKADLSFSSQLEPFTLLLHCLRSASVLGFPAPPLLHPELRHVTWRCSWSDWVTSGEGVYKVCCLACSYFSFTPSRLFVDMFGSSARAIDCVKDRLSPGSHLSVTQTSYILTRCEI